MDTIIPSVCVCLYSLTKACEEKKSTKYSVMNWIFFAIKGLKLKLDPKGKEVKVYVLRNLTLSREFGEEVRYPLCGLQIRCELSDHPRVPITFVAAVFRFMILEV